MMKKILQSLFVLVCVLVVQTISAQDVITLKTGEDINVKVLEVGSNDVKYKKSDNPDGPSYTLLKSEVFMIKYQNGSKDVFNTTAAPTPEPATSAPAPTTADTKKEVETGIKNYQAQQDYDKNMKIYKKRLGSGIACTAIGVPFIITGAALVGVGVNYINVADTYGYYESDIDYEERGLVMALSGAALVLAGIPLTIVGPIKIGTSFKYKRLAKEAKANISFVPSVEPANAIYGAQAGMAMRINF